MIQRHIEALIENEKKKGQFIHPFYESFCFSNIPSTILSFFDIKTKRPVLPSELHKDKVETENSNKIVFLLIDGFGYDQWLRNFRNYVFFDIFSRKGLVSPITTIFPSTTAAATTTINSGLTPQEHGLPEWTVYFEEIDMIINTLPFTPIGEKGQDKLLENQIDPKILFRGRTIYQDLKKNDVKSFTFVDKSYEGSVYSKLVLKGSKTIPFINSSDMVVNLRKNLEKEKGPAYFFVYVGSLDSMEHRYGPHTDQYHAELSVLSYLLKRELLEKLDRKVAKETLFLLTADHGQVNVSPKDTVYLNRYRKLTKNFQKSRRRKPILPTGGPRDVFLHIKPERLNETLEYLSKKFAKKAKILKSSEAVDMSLFGIGKPKKKFLDRIGNLLILPYNNNTMWYEHKKGKKSKHLGHHGGLSRKEMLIPFAIARISELIK